MKRDRAKSIVRLFLDKVVLVVVITLLVSMVQNTMNLDRHQLGASIVALLALGYLIVHTVNKTPESRTVTVMQLMPNLIGEGGQPVTNAYIIVQNNSIQIDERIYVYLRTPIIKSHSIEHPDRLQLTGGGANGNFLQIWVPQLLPGEKQVISIAFRAPEKFTSVDEWRRQYEIPTQVIVHRLKVGDPQPVKIPATHR